MTSNWHVPGTSDRDGQIGSLGDVGGGRPGDQYLPGGEMLVFFKIRRISKLLGSK